MFLDYFRITASVVRKYSILENPGQPEVTPQKEEPLNKTEHVCVFVYA